MRVIYSNTKITKKELRVVMSKTVKRVLSLGILTILALALCVSTLATGYQSQYDLVGKMTTGNASGNPWIVDRKIQLQKGQAIYFMVDTLGSDNVFVASDVATYLDLTLTGAGRTWRFDADNGPTDTQGGTNGEGFHYVWSWAEVPYLTGASISDLDSYFASILDNVIDMAYAPAGPRGYADIGMGGENSWGPGPDVAPVYPNWAGILGDYKVISPTISDTSDSIAEGKSYSIRVGIQLIAPETGEYVLTMAPWSPWGAGSTSVLVLTEKATAAGGGSTSTNPKTGDAFGILLSTGLLTSGGLALPFLRKRGK